jgi:hypothetical protein
VVGDSVADLAQLVAERFLAESVAVRLGVGQDAGGGCDEVRVQVRIAVGARLLGAFRLAGAERRAGCQAFGGVTLCGVSGLARG